MKLKNFDDYLKKRLDAKEIKDIEHQAKVEYQALKSLQKDVAQFITQYMVDEQIGFNEIVRRLNVSPAQVSKIQKGEANLTLASLAHLAGLCNKGLHLTFKDLKK